MAAGSRVVITVAAGVPLGRISHPKDVSNTVAFLASSKASSITGETIVVSGGLVMRAAGLTWNSDHEIL